MNLQALCLALAACLFCAANTAFSQSSSGDAASKEAMPIRLVSGEFDPLAAKSASLSSLSSPTLAAADLAASPARKTAAADLAKAKAALSERQVRLVQFETLPTAEDLAALQAQGIEVVRYVPENSYIVMAPGAKVRAGLLAAGKSAAKTRIRWSGAFPSGSKLHPSVKAALQARIASSQAAQTAAQAAATSTAAANRLRRFDVMALDTGNLAALTDEIKNQQGAVIRQSGALSSRRVTMDYPLESIANLETLNCVAWIDFWHKPHKCGEREAQICAGNLNTGQSCSIGGGGGYQTWLNSVGLSGEGMVVNIMDDGLSKGIATNAAGTAHVDIVGRIAGIDNATGDPLGDGGAGHGHLNTSIIMGQPKATGSGISDSSGFYYGQGVAPKAKVWATKVFQNAGDWDTGSQSITDLAQKAVRAGAVVSSNSWGTDSAGAYDADSVEFDTLTRDSDPGTPGYQPMTYVFAAGNAGPGASTIGSPSTGKNVIAVGAGENCDAGPTDGCNTPSTEADNVKDLASFSSRGPCTDGRIGVTLFAPGTHVMGAASDSANFDGSGVCGAAGNDSKTPPTDAYYPSGQTNYTYSSGTSHSTPLVAGGAILFAEFYKKQFGAIPSPAMARAALVNSSVDCAGGSSNDSATLAAIPNAKQGWGRMNLQNLFSMDRPRFFVDQTQVFTATGQTWEKRMQVADSTKPLRVTLAWTDEPGFTGASKAIVNNLDLQVTFQGSTWLGNVFSNGQSATGGSADALNTLECVYLPTPALGIYTIRVAATSLAGDALPLSGGQIEQDFALMVSNAADQLPAGTASWNRRLYRCSDWAKISVSDSDLRGAGTVMVEARSLASGDVETVTLTEKPAGGGILEGWIMTSASAPASGNHILEAAAGDTLRVTYQDANNGSGQTATATADAAMDCQAPGLTANEVQQRTESSAQIVIQSDEPTTMLLEYGSSCQNFPNSLTDAVLGAIHTIPLTGLSACKVYYYRLTLTDEAGNSATFTNSGRCYSLATLQLTSAYSNTFESSSGEGWTHSAATGTDDWTWVSAPAYTQSQTHAWRATDVETIKDSFLISPSLEIPANGILQFYHTYDFEIASNGEGYDGAVIEISTDSGASWTDLGPKIVQGGYNAVVSSDYSSPIGGREAWSGGALGTPAQVKADLSAYAGSGRLIRWRIACDSDTAGGAWYVDDVSILMIEECMSSRGTITASPNRVSCSGSFEVEVSDTDLTGLGKINVSITIPPSSTSAILALTEDAQHPGVFTGRVSTSPRAQGGAIVAGTLSADEGAAITITYQDENTGDGTPAAAQASALLDCTAPIISSVQISEIASSSAKITWLTNELASGRALAGAACGSSDQTAAETSLLTSHQLLISGLNPAARYFVTIESSDAAGNLARDNNLGACYSFQTGEAAIDLSGWTLQQENSAQTFTIPSGVTISPGQFLILARESERAAFETFWKTTLPASAIFINSEARMPQINGDETFKISDSAGQVVDGPSIAIKASQTLQRVSFSLAASSSSAWKTGALTASTPGRLDASPAGAAKLLISEASDASGSGNYTYEFIEFYYDAPIATFTPTSTASPSPTPSPTAKPKMDVWLCR